MTNARWLAAVTILGLSATASASPRSGAAGRYRVEAAGDAAFLAGSVELTPAGREPGLALRIGDRAVATSAGPDAAGRWVFRGVRAVAARGLAGAVRGADPEPAEAWRLRLLPSQDGFTGRLETRSGRAAAVVLTRAPRALLIPAWSGEEGVDTRVFLGVAEQMAAFYRGRGYETEVLQGRSVEHLIAALGRQRRNGGRFARVVFIGHGGWDGPLLGTGEDADGREVTMQASAQEGTHLWPALVTAIADATTPDARIYSSSCHAGGSDRYERREDWGGIYDYVWVDDLARRAGRVVAGPSGRTSVEYTLRQVKAALEGEGTVAQETRWASPSGARRIGYHRALDDTALQAWAPARAARTVDLALGVEPR